MPHAPCFAGSHLTMVTCAPPCVWLLCELLHSCSCPTFRREPARLLGLPASTSRTIATNLAAKKLRNAPWSIKRLFNYGMCYKFLQTHVVQPAFEIKKSGAVTSDAISRVIGDRYKAVAILPRSLPDITVDLTGLVGFCLAYTHLSGPLVPTLTASVHWYSNMILVPGYLFPICLPDLHRLHPAPSSTMCKPVS